MLRQRVMIGRNNDETTPLQTRHNKSNLKTDNVITAVGAATSKQYNNNNNNQPIFSEWKIAFSALILSLFIIIVKIYYYIYRESILERKLISYKKVLTTAEQGDDAILKFMWTTTIKYSKFWLPLICGFLTTYFTWLMVYLDSSQPGIQPPSPFSPTKYKQKSGHAFHLNYIFAVLIGTIITLYMYWRGICI